MDEIPVKYIHNAIAMVTSISPQSDLQNMRMKVREICHFTEAQTFTLKWIDEEQDPCVLSTDLELKEAIRLHFLNKECQLTVLVFDGVPSAPGKPCPGEDLMYRRGAKRWKKKYYVLLGHKFAARRFNKNAQCVYCHGRIWGLGQPGFKCINCRLLLHRRCQGCVQHKCGENTILPSSSVDQPSLIRLTPLPSSTASLSTPIATTDDGTPSRPSRLVPDDYGQRADAGYTSGTGLVHKGEPTHYAIPRDDNSIVISYPQVVPVTGDTADERKQPAANMGTIINVRNSFMDPSSGRGNMFPRHESPNEVLINGQRNFDPNPVKNVIIAPPAISSAGKVGLEDFRMLKVIGRGSYAKVFQVEHIPTQRVYAMKVIKKETILDEEDIEWVQTEKHVFECATNHPFLVGLHSCFQTDSRLFFVIEFVSGGDLMFYMQRNLRLPEDYARFYAAEISIALNFLHERGIIYRDLKLDNVLMDHEGHVKLTDYGMCKEGMSADVMTSTFCGTPNYIAPEILRGEHYNFSVDWWALGVLTFEMLAGRSPWEGVGQSANPDQNTEDYLFQVILHRPIRYPRSISVRATNLLRAFLVKNPLDRLGCPPSSSFADIMNFPFFKLIDWVALEQKQIPPPYRPSVDNNYDLVHFDPTFTNEPVAFTPDNEKTVAQIDQSEFEGFEYINPLLMSLDVAV